MRFRLPWTRNDDKKPEATAKRPPVPATEGSAPKPATATPSPMRLAVNKLVDDMAALQKDLKAEREQRKSLEEQRQELHEALTQLHKRVANIEKAHRRLAQSHEDANKRRVKRSQWCNPKLLEAPAEVPGSIQKNTLAAMQGLIRWSPATYAALTDPQNFRRTEHWGLYWLLANAAAKSASATKKQTEDGGSTVFSECVRGAAESLKADGVFDAQELIRVERIFHNRSGAVLEKDVGADLLLVTSGQSLIGSTGLRLFWLQAKRPDKTTFNLNYWRDTTNDGGLRQVEALRSVHAPERGSFGLYLQYLGGWSQLTRFACRTSPSHMAPTRGVAL